LTGIALDRLLFSCGMEGAGVLKGKGGTVGATTVTNPGFLYISNLFMNPFAEGRLKVKRYDASGKLIGSQSVNRYGTVK